MKLRCCQLAAVAAAASLFACQDARGPLVVPDLRFDLTAHWVDQSHYPGVGAGRILITNNGDDTVSILDLGQVGQPGFGELLRKPVGLIPADLEGPHNMALDPAGEFYYIGISNFVLGGGAGPHGAHGSGTADGWLLKFRAADNTFAGQVRLDRNPGDLVTSRDGKTVYVTHFDLLRITEVAARGGTMEEMRARLAIIDAETLTRRAMVPICAAPHGAMTSFDDRRV